MAPYKKRLNKYIRRMAEDMQLRNFADTTIGVSSLTRTIE